MTAVLTSQNTTWADVALAAATFAVIAGLLALGWWRDRPRFRP